MEEYNYNDVVTYDVGEDVTLHVDEGMDVMRLLRTMVLMMLLRDSFEITASSVLLPLYTNNSSISHLDYCQELNAVK